MNDNPCLTSSMTCSPSAADEDLLTQYSEGKCHVLALALHRHLGWEMVLVIDNNAPYWEDAEDPDNFIASVVHAYAVDREHRAWDIHGCRPAEDMVRETQERFCVFALDTDWLCSEGELTSYVGEWGEPEIIDRPLAAFVEADVAEAWIHAQRVFKGLTQWSPHSPTPVRRGLCP